MYLVRKSICLLLITLLLADTVPAAKLSIVIDDVGYRLQQENLILRMPSAIALAILPNAPHARLMATKAHQQGREVLIHMPMAPLGKHPQERDTLQPAMTQSEIRRIIANAVDRVPYAVGMNNHTGSAMTANLAAMEKVMRVLADYQLYFLDSRTTVETKAVAAAVKQGVKVLERKVFLDDSANPDEIRFQFKRAINLARRHGAAIAIGHPRPATIAVLQQMLSKLPADIELVAPSSLLPPSPQQSDQTPKDHNRLLHSPAWWDSLKHYFSHSLIIQTLQRYWQQSEPTDKNR
ncbi:divergent polysaccharide deacetylase family protein [Serratia microhaemolytica]|uniref:divergent polysaccharide deacetylase family protein n=1 Tax=Serratia microhaemolytica TaxID=2675110 RepID=UPI003B832A9E